MAALLPAQLPSAAPAASPEQQEATSVQECTLHDMKRVSMYRRLSVVHTCRKFPVDVPKSGMLHQSHLQKDKQGLGTAQSIGVAAWVMGASVSGGLEGEMKLRDLDREMKRHAMAGMQLMTRTTHR